MPRTIYIRLPHHTAFLSSHSIISIFTCIILFQMCVMLSVWSKLRIPGSLKSVERLNSNRLRSLAWVSTSRARVRSRVFPRRRAIAERGAPTELHCARVSGRNVLGKDWWQQFTALWKLLPFCLQPFYHCCVSAKNQNSLTNSSRIDRSW